jgi:YHS domain-containing protein
MKEDSMLRRNVLGIFVCAGLLFLEGVFSVAAQSPTKVPSYRYNLMGESIGLVGYDPVSYFIEGGGRPQKGLFKLSYEYDGVTYRFATQQNLDLFKAEPTKYLPQYGGWCTWSLGALNKRADIDPECYVVRDGRLYLFYRDAALDTRELWLKDSESLLQKAKANWPKLSK